ncbi:CpXC motif protein [Breznakia blatticola]|uniref:CpXC motif protein n=1 Tax=Breznakia blatticola TaxID=1754012 RepID=A0A4R7ZTV1_9FIRM|nr:CpXC domain-containing protein [Breznakia blatticola]TDW20996.1 CpXC motif protein [Breznakia blatticola]
MQEKLFQLVCPTCKQEFYIKRDTIINHEIDENLVPLVTNRSLFVHTCENCKTTFPLDYPVLYYFPKQRMYIGYQLKGEGSITSTYIEASTMDMFVEYVHILQDGIDLEAILPLKDGVLKGYTYDGKDDHQLFFRKEEQLICLKRRD